MEMGERHTSSLMRVRTAALSISLWGTLCLVRNPMSVSSLLGTFDIWFIDVLILTTGKTHWLLYLSIKLPCHQLGKHGGAFGQQYYWFLVKNNVEIFISGLVSVLTTLSFRLLVSSSWLEILNSESKTQNSAAIVIRDFSERFCINFWCLLLI